MKFDTRAGPKYPRDAPRSEDSDGALVLKSAAAFPTRPRRHFPAPGQVRYRSRTTPAWLRRPCRHSVQGARTAGRVPAPSMTVITKAGQIRKSYKPPTFG